jgi:hypothetical protein
VPRPRPIRRSEGVPGGVSTRALNTTQESPKAVRELIDSVIIHPSAGDPDIAIKGRLAVLAGVDLLPQVKRVAGKLVAEDGFEPPTRGL